MNKYKFLVYCDNRGIQDIGENMMTWELKERGVRKNKKKSSITAM